MGDAGGGIATCQRGRPSERRASLVSARRRGGRGGRGGRGAELMAQILKVAEQARCFIEATCL